MWSFTRIILRGPRIAVFTDVRVADLAVVVVSDAFVAEEAPRLHYAARVFATPLIYESSA